MKTYALLVFLILAKFAVAQQPLPGKQDPNFKFDQKIVSCENKWVVIPRNTNSPNYPYGFIYIDPQAGFTLDLQGYFSIDKDGKYMIDSVFLRDKPGPLKYRIGAGFKNVVVLNPIHYAELHIIAEPEWLKAYQSPYVDNAENNYRLGFIYNDAGDSQKALAYLEKVNKQNPNYKGLPFELAFAYNVLKQFTTAEKIASAAIQTDTRNLLLYRELGMAYLGESNLSKALEVLRSGLENCPDANNSDKAEMAFNLAKVYNTQGNTLEYKAWGAKAKDWADIMTPLYRNLVGMGF